MLKGKKIILGITGSISAYKAAFLCRLLIKSEAEVRVVMTTSASAFISPLSLSTLSKHPVQSALDLPTSPILHDCSSSPHHQTYLFARCVYLM